MNLLFALNSGYIRQMCVCLRSIMKSNPVTEFDVYVAHSSLTEDDFAALRRNVDENRCRIIPVTVDDSVFSEADILSRTSKETYYRLLAMDFLPESVERILYLDPDIVVINPLDGFYGIEFQGNLFAGASHFKWFINTFNRLRLRQPETVPYINAGVLLMNIKQLRAEFSSKDVTDFIKNTKIKLYLADQDVLNIMYYKRIISVDPMLYNLDEKTLKKHGKNTSPDTIHNKTVIIHYNGKEKPWKGDYSGRLGSYYFETEKDLI